jgi:hypothetical protein
MTIVASVRIRDLHNKRRATGAFFQSNPGFPGLWRKMAFGAEFVLCGRSAVPPTGD